ncbi:MAG: NUDIX hydrolase [Betaproteobacteria bacterium]
MRSYPERPIVGVGAVILDGDRVVLVRRGSEPLKGLWSIPGGAVEIGETCPEAIAREVLEETGLVVEVGPIAAVVDRIRRDEDGRVAFHYVLVDYVCRAVGGTLAAASDAAECAWVPVAEAGRFDLTEGTLAVIQDAARSVPGR